MWCLQCIMPYHLFNIIEIFENDNNNYHNNHIVENRQHICWCTGVKNSTKPSSECISDVWLDVPGGENFPSLHTIPNECIKVHIVVKAAWQSRVNDRQSGDGIPLGHLKQSRKKNHIKSHTATVDAPQWRCQTKLHIHQCRISICLSAIP